MLVARNLKFGDFRLVEVVEECVHMEPNKSTNREVVNWCCWGSTSKQKLDTWNCQMAIRKSNGLLSWFSRCDVANRKVMDIHGWMDVLCTNFLFSRWGCVIYDRPGSHKEHCSDPQRVAIQRGSQCVPRRRKQSRRHIRGWAERLLGYGPYKLWVIVEGLKVVMWPWFLSASTSGSPFVRAFAQSYPIQIGKKCEEQVPVATFKRTSATMRLFIAITTPTIA